MKQALALLAPTRARLAAWWAGLSGRERRLVTLFAALALTMAVAQLVVRPLLAANLAARNDIRAYDLLNARLRAAGSSLGAQAPRRAGTPAEVVAASAAQAGITISLQPSSDGVRAIAADIPYEAAIRWLADVEATTTLRIRRATLERRPAPGVVTAQVELAK